MNSIPDGNCWSLPVLLADTLRKMPPNGMPRPSGHARYHTSPRQRPQLAGQKRTLIEGRSQRTDVPGGVYSIWPTWKGSAEPFGVLKSGNIQINSREETVKAEAIRRPGGSWGRGGPHGLAEAEEAEGRAEESGFWGDVWSHRQRRTEEQVPETLRELSGAWGIPQALVPLRPACIMVPCM